MYILAFLKSLWILWKLIEEKKFHKIRTNHIMMMMFLGTIIVMNMMQMIINRCFRIKKQKKRKWGEFREHWIPTKKKKKYGKNQNIHEYDYVQSIYVKYSFVEMERPCQQFHLFIFHIRLSYWNDCHWIRFTLFFSLEERKAKRQRGKELERRHPITRKKISEESDVILMKIDGSINHVNHVFCHVIMFSIRPFEQPNKEKINYSHYS